MYKSGKNWVVAPIVFFGLGLTAMTQSVSADQANSPADTTDGSAPQGEVAQAPTTTTADASSMVKDADQNANAGDQGNNQAVTTQDATDVNANQGQQQPQTQGNEVVAPQANGGTSKSDAYVDGTDGNQKDSRFETTANSYATNAWVAKENAANTTTGGNDYYYYDETGAMVKGQKDIKDNDGKVYTYYFDATTGVLQTGFVTNNGKTNYYANGDNGRYKDIMGRMIKDQRYDITKDGQKHTYRFDANGNMQTGFVDETVGGVAGTYFYNADGQLVKGNSNTNYKTSSTATMGSGDRLNGIEIPVGEYWYLLDATTGRVIKNTFVSLPGVEPGVRYRTVFYDGEGHMLHGEVPVGSQWYNFNSTDGTISTGLTTLPDGRTVFYADHDYVNQTGYEDHDHPGSKIPTIELGQMIHGSAFVPGTGYAYFDDVTGAMKKNELVTISDDNGTKTVFYNDKGQISYGEVAIGDYWYNFADGTGAMVKDAFADIKDKDGNVEKTVYYNADGHMLHGEVPVGDGWFHFDETSGARSEGLTYLPEANKTVYYATAKDVAAAAAKGNSTLKVGQMLYGKQNVNGTTMYFDPVTGALQK